MRMGRDAASAVLHRGCSGSRCPPPRSRPAVLPDPGVPVLDLVSVVVVIATFALIGPIAKGVEKL